MRDKLCNLFTALFAVLFAASLGTAYAVESATGDLAAGAGVFRALELPPARTGRRDPARALAEHRYRGTRHVRAVRALDDARVAASKSA